MNKIRVLCVDDSSLIRKMLTECLSSDPGIEVLPPAVNGAMGVRSVARLNPDAVVMDIEMPELDGVAAVREIRKTNTKVPIVMFSTLTQLGATATLDALSAGASDYFTKPSNTGSLEKSVAIVKEQLIPKLKALVNKNPYTAAPSVSAPTPATAATKPSPSGLMGAKPSSAASKIKSRVDIVLIGVSTGGPSALAELLPRLAKDFPVPILVTQHMPPLFTRLLAERLGSQSAIAIEEARPGVALEPGKVWIAPGDYHMVLRRDNGQIRIFTNQDPPENSCRPAVDPMFRSGVEFFGRNCLAVILTGMGYDGLLGAKKVHEVGGQILAQDEPSSVVWGMPGAIAQAGIADAILPLQSMATEISRRVAEGRTTSNGCAVGKL